MSKKVLTKDDILHLAKLASLDLSEQEVEKFKTQLSETLDYVGNLDQLDTKKVEPTNQTTNLNNVSFEDGAKCERMLDKKGTFANSKKKDGNYFVVDKVL